MRPDAAGGAASADAVWADLGSGGGAFTLALADVIGTSAVIHSVDRDGGALREQERRVRARFPDARATTAPISRGRWTYRRSTVS